MINYIAIHLIFITTPINISLLTYLGDIYRYVPFCTYLGPNCISAAWNIAINLAPHLNLCISLLLKNAGIKFHTGSIGLKLLYDIFKERKNVIQEGKPPQLHHLLVVGEHSSIAILWLATMYWYVNTKYWYFII